MNASWKVRGRTFAVAFALGVFSLNAAQASWPPAPGECVGYIPPPPGVTDKPLPLMAGNPAKPLAYRDHDSGVSFYVESDGRHLAAISSDGKLLWVRNPFVDRRLCPYRNERPIIVRIEPANPFEINALETNLKRKIQGITIWFDSSQFGIVDIRTGDFFFMGQN